MKYIIPQDYAVRIKVIRHKLGLTQMRLAELMGVSFASVNRWENGQARPNSLAWKKIERVEVMGYHALLDSPAAGASDDDEKMCMAGLYIREMLLRGLIQRILIITPGNMLSIWQRIMRQQFNLSFRILAGLDSAGTNPFKNGDSNLIITSLEILGDGAFFALLREPGVEPYEVAILDEPHSTSPMNASRHPMDKIRRQQIANALTGLNVADKRWRLPWRARHLLVLSAHVNKNFGD